MELSVVADLAEILRGVTVIGGVAFGMVQLAEYRRQRLDMVAVETVRAFQNNDFARALGLIRELPDDTSLQEIRARGRHDHDAAMLIAANYEWIGLLTFRRAAQFRVVRELAGGICVVMWRKLARWTRDMREEQAHQSFAECFQWLAERLDQYGDDKNVNPAYVRHAAWRPRA
jgi:hypothetical protein